MAAVRSLAGFSKGLRPRVGPLGTLREMSAPSWARRDVRPYDFRGIDNAIELFFGDKTELESGRFVGRSLDKQGRVILPAGPTERSTYRWSPSALSAFRGAFNALPSPSSFRSTAVSRA
jgi:hypothetical protein